MRLVAQGIAGHLLQIMIVISIYNDQLKISVHPVRLVFTRPGKNLLHREKVEYFLFIMYFIYTMKSAEWTAVSGDGKLLCEKRGTFLV